MPNKKANPTRRPRRRPPEAVDLKATKAAQIWVLREEGKSYRQIHRELRVDYSFISATLSSNPGRQAGLIAAQREERARLWQHHENASLKQAIAFQAAVFASYFTDAGKIKKGKLTTLKREGARWAAIMRQSANDAAGRINLLSGGPTERIETTQADEQTLGTEGLITKAIAIGRIDLLPPVLQIEARKRAAP